MAGDWASRVTVVARVLRKAQKTALLYRLQPPFGVHVTARQPSVLMHRAYLCIVSRQMHVTISAICCRLTGQDEESEEEDTEEEMDELNP